MVLGVDTGGTFTDFVWWEDGRSGENGRFRIHKQLSTPHDPAEAILQGVALLQIPPLAELVHGSTVATNALLERRGAKTALITTKGFADVLEIGRQNRPDLYALTPQKPAPLVPAPWRFEVDERIGARGEVIRPFNPDDLTPILQIIAAAGIESIAVCLLFSFLYPHHEQQIKDAISKWGQAVNDGSRSAPTNALPPGANLHISLSSEILPEYREYERTAATVINAYVAPIMSRYLRRLARGLHGRKLSVMQSNGGIISAAAAGNEAARTVLSGPAGGVVGARYAAQQAGFRQIITFDMGGTSTDVALCPGHLPTTARGEIAGLPLRLPIIDIHTVGAGGGSLAYLDAGGALHVGPQSAGADPGPACYGKNLGNVKLEIGGQSPGSSFQVPVTVTDANLVLGRLDADHFLGGTMRLHAEAARAALADLAAQMKVNSPEEAAWGVIQVANANMERAIRKISVERGYDPRLFTLLPFGGAGPLHACDLAQNLQIPQVLIPPVPGVLSALGMLVAAPTKDFSQTAMLVIGEGEWETVIAARLHSLQERAVVEMAGEGFTATKLALHTSLDMRYLGQSHELTIPAGADGLLLDEKFHLAHERRYGYARRESLVEVVTVRVTAVAPAVPPVIPAQPLENADPMPAWLGEKPVWFGQRPLPTKMFDRDKLRPGNRFTGPAVIFQYDTTNVIPPGWQVTVDAYKNILASYP